MTDFSIDKDEIDNIDSGFHGVSREGNLSSLLLSTDDLNVNIHCKKIDRKDNYTKGDERLGCSMNIKSDKLRKSFTIDGEDDIKEFIKKLVTAKTLRKRAKSKNINPAYYNDRTFFEDYLEEANDSKKLNHFIDSMIDSILYPTDEKPLTKINNYIDKLLKSTDYIEVDFRDVERYGASTFNIEALDLKPYFGYGEDDDVKTIVHDKPTFEDFKEEIENMGLVGSECENVRITPDEDVEICKGVEIEEEDGYSRVNTTIEIDGKKYSVDRDMFPIMPEFDEYIKDRLKDNWTKIENIKSKIVLNSRTKIKNEYIEDKLDDAINELGKWGDNNDIPKTEIDKMKTNLESYVKLSCMEGINSLKDTNACFDHAVLSMSERLDDAYKDKFLGLLDGVID